MGQQADAIAELEHEVRARLEIGVAAADVNHHGSLLAGQLEITERPTHHGPPGREYPQIVEIPAILRPGGLIAASPSAARA